jgi:uncharacterized protein (TIGR02246 family)
MKSFTLKAIAGIITTLTTLFMQTSCNKPAEKEKQLIETIKNISAKRAKAFNEGDAASIASYFASDCFLMAPGGATKRTPKDVQAYYQSIFDSYHTALESGYEEVKVDGNLAYGRGYAKVKLVSKKDSTTQFSTAKYLNILEKQPDGRWLTTHDIWNNNE